jgi:predicted phage terminase large subunit-like protein
MSSTLSSEEYLLVLRSDLMSFIERSFYELNPQAVFSPSPHIEVLASRLEECRRGKTRRLIINQPPRSLKSHSASVAYPAWLLGHNPASQIICASYGQDLSDKHARDCRTLVASGFYRGLFPQTCLAPEKQSVNEFMTTAKGFRMSTSVGGVLTGRGADIIILDDPLKPDDALSETRRTSVNEWYDNSLLSRLNSKADGVIIIVMQRLHQDDLVGHVIAQEDWEVISFPAIAEEKECHPIRGLSGSYYFTRVPGDVLEPNRESRSTLGAIRRTIGEYNFASQYQQNPVPLDGAMIKRDWLKYYDPDERPSTFGCVLQSWDTANKSGELNDFSVCTTWGVTHDSYYLLEVYRKRLNYPELKRAVREKAEQYQSSIILIEDKASGTQLIQDLTIDGLWGLTPYLPPPGADKLLRLYSQSAEFENGRVLLPREAAWPPEYVQELLTFPGCKYDDQVDSTTQALMHLKNYSSALLWARI